jgi:SAM-dependent methyltransferase
MAKPAGLGPEYVAQFDDPSVVAAYPTRPPYPESLITLIGDIAATPRTRILDLGCGTGELARRLARHVAAIAAVDRSPRMIDAARRMPGGDAPNIDWIVGEVESLSLSGKFDLVIAAESFHWFDWPRACARITELVPTARLVLVEGRFEVGPPWSGALASLIAAFSTNRDFIAYDLVDELTSRGCFSIDSRMRLGPVRYRQSIDDYMTSIHSRNGFSRDRMSRDSGLTFDEAVRRLITPHARDQILDLQIETRVAYGKLSTGDARQA